MVDDLGPFKCDAVLDRRDLTDMALLSSLNVGYSGVDNSGDENTAECSSFYKHGH